MSYWSAQICECGCRLTLAKMIETGGKCPDCGEVYFTIEVDESAPPIDPKSLPGEINAKVDPYGDWPSEWW